MLIKTIFGVVCAAVFVGAIVGELMRAGSTRKPKQSTAANHINQ